MQKYFLFWITLNLISGTRLDFESNDCRIYLEKFQSVNNADDNKYRGSKISFSGSASFTRHITDVEIKLRYSDFDYFDDPLFQGLVIQDGKTPQTTCLDMKLFRYTDRNFLRRFQVTDLPITPLKNQMKKQRIYSFIIKGNELPTRLIKTRNSDFFIYQGYYAIVYYPIDMDKPFFIFKFGITVTVNRLTGAAVDTSFKRIAYQYYDLFSSEYYQSKIPKTSICQCTYFTCTQFAQPNLCFYNQSLQSRLNSQGLSKLYESIRKVDYSDDGIRFEVLILLSDELRFDPNIHWRLAFFKFPSVLQRMFMKQKTQSTQRIVKVEVSDVQDQYPNQILYVFLLLLLLFAS